MYIYDSKDVPTIWLQQTDDEQREGLQFVSFTEVMNFSKYVI